ncbi:MAG TPA: NAD-dependent malic enzyme [Firmicutes bacterium]|nr:NAD-dependent malic enzyme [Candidatus Fermentithermobacillaceae bacterium]
MSLKDEALELHRKNRGKIEVNSKVPLRDRKDLSLAYTPGVAEACLEIAGDQALAYEYTCKGNLIAVLSDGTAVLGLGDIGPAAALPVMEGKSLLFKKFAGVDAIPLCVNTKSVDDIVQIVKWLEPTLGGVNLEDISAPRCFEIERRLKVEVGIPVFHDDQHGTAVVALAALINALKVVRKSLDSIRVVVNGAGAAGLATANLLLDSGVRDVVVCDRHGAIYPERTEGLNEFKLETARRGNIRGVKGSLADALKGADVFIGVSAPKTVTQEMVRSMASDAIVIAMANPVPEIFPDEAKAAGAAVVGTGRSDFPNQVNNVLAFPGILRGALDTRAKVINEAMKVAAAKAIAGLITDEELGPDYVIPDPFDKRVAPTVAREVARAAMDTGVAGIKVDPDEVYTKTQEMAK